jgi:hypothetical protein
MVSCAEFRNEYSDYRDGQMGLPRRVEMEDHRAACAGCARYDRVIGRGIAALKTVPPITPSYDFLPRLQHRLHHLDDERSAWSRSDLSGTSVGFVLLLVVLIAGAAWIPVLRAKPLVVHLPPALAVAPPPPAPVHALFRSGPLLDRPLPPPRLTSAPPQTIFFRYMPLGMHLEGQQREHHTADYQGR